MRDLLSECVADMKSKVPDMGAKDVQAALCAHCRNSECSLAKWGVDKFGQRVSTQADRLLRPTQIDPSQYSGRLVNFVDRSAQAERLEVSTRRGDWSTPESDAPEDLGIPDLMADTPAPQGPVSPLPNRAPVFHPPAGNIPVPSGGLMVGGGPPTVSPASRPAPTPAHDPWAARPAGKVQVVKPGSRIVLGGGKKDE